MANRKITIQIIKEEFDKLGYDVISTEYINNHTPIEYICRKHPKNGVQTVLYCNIQKGQGACHACGREKQIQKARRTHEQCQEKVFQKNPHIILITPNPGAQDMVQCYCKKHNKNFTKFIRTLYYHESGCEECYREWAQKTTGKLHSEYLKELEKVHPELEVLSPYKNNHSYIEVYCKIHDYTYSTNARSLLSKKSCCPKNFITAKEKQVGDVLEKWGYKITRQKTFPDCRDSNLLCFDYYLDDFNIAIEYDGENHYHPVKFGTQEKEEALQKHIYTKRHDEIKNEYCKKHNIPLLRIPYWEFEDLEYFLFDNLEKLGAIEEVPINKTA